MPKKRGSPPEIANDIKLEMRAGESTGFLAQNYRGSWKARKLGGWEARKMGSWEAGKPKIHKSFQASSIICQADFDLISSTRI